MTRYASPSHVAVPTELHARWEADQAPYTDAADDDVDEQQQQARRDSGGGGGESGGWVPQPGAGLPLNQYVIHFESDLFVGKMLSYIKGLPSSHEPYFTGKKRRSVLMLQASGNCLRGRPGGGARGRASSLGEAPET